MATQPLKKSPAQLKTDNVLHPLFDKEGQSPMKSKIMLILPVVVIVLLGGFSGYWLVTNNSQTMQEDGTVSLMKKGGQGTEEGINDEQQFPDEAEGTLEVNGDADATEGTHQLVRPGGPSQTVYLTSSVVDLSKFEGAKVKIKGETMASQTVGWLMDVGWIKVVE